MAEAKENRREIIRKACAESCGVSKRPNVTIRFDHLVEAVGPEAAKELAGEAHGGVASVCPRRTLDAIEKGDKPSGNATGKPGGK